MIKSGAYLDAIVEKIAILKTAIATNGKAGLLNIHKNSERIVAGLLNRIYKYNLVIFKKPNHPAIDLGDEGRGIGYQVSSDSSLAKVENTLNLALKHETYKKFPVIKIVFTSQNQPKHYNIRVKTEPHFSFTSQENIVNLDDLVADIQAKDLDDLKDIYEFLRAEIPTESDARFKTTKTPWWVWGLAPAAVVCAIIFWPSNPESSAVPYQEAATNNVPVKKTLVRISVLPFKNDAGANIAGSIKFDLDKIIKEDSLDMEVLTPSYTWGNTFNDSVRAGLLKELESDFLVWGEKFVNNGKDLYTLQFVTSKWPNLNFNDTSLIDLDIKKVSGSGVKGNLPFVVRYLEGVLNYLAIAEIPDRQQVADTLKRKVDRRVNKGIKIFLGLKKETDPTLKLSDSVDLYLGSAYQYLDSNALAIRSFKTYLSNVGDQADVLNNIGAAYYGLDDLKNAVEYADKAVKASNGKLTYIFNRGSFLMESGKYKQAIDDFERTKAIYLKDAVYFGVANCWYHLRKCSRALAYVDTAIQLRTEANYFTLKGNILAQMGRDKEADSAYRQALSRNINDIEATIGSLEANLKLKKNQEAFNFASWSIIRFPRNFALYVHRGSALANMERYDEAIADFNTAIQLAPNSPFGYFGRGGVYVRQKNFSAFRKDSLMVTKLMRDPKNPTKELIYFTYDSTDNNPKYNYCD